LPNYQNLIEVFWLYSSSDSRQKNRFCVTIKDGGDCE
jgi:hypothetical protein